MKLEPSTDAPLVIRKFVQACDWPNEASRTIRIRCLMVFMMSLLLGNQKLRKMGLVFEFVHFRMRYAQIALMLAPI